MNILYVEDNKINAIVMNKMLSKSGFGVSLVYNPTDALEIVTKETFDLILVDINLGLNQMDGCELLQHFRKIDSLKETPMYAVTAYAMPGDENKFLSIGFNKYFSKPVDFDKLLEAINAL